MADTFPMRRTRSLPGPSSRRPGVCEDAALAEQAAHAGRMLEVAHRSGDRELALIWQRAMLDMVRLRRARRYGWDTQDRGGCERGG